MVRMGSSVQVRSRALRIVSPCFRPVAPIGRASVSKTECCGFESCLACFALGRRSFLKYVEEQLVKKFVAFFQNSYAELKKVTWPSREEVGSSTRVVLISVAIFAAILGILDYLFLTGIDFIF